MANTCNICGAQINLIQTQKLADGNCICRKSCRSKGFKCFDYVHATLPDVKAHIDQVQKGTGLWNQYFVPKMKEKDKEKKLVRFGGNLYIASDIGLMAFVQNDYKFLMFGKTTRACVYRIADIRDYEFETQEVKSGDKTEKKHFVRIHFANTTGMYEFLCEVSSHAEYKRFVEYFDKLFGIQKTLGNVVNNAKKQVGAAMDVAAGLKAAMKGDTDMVEKADKAATSVDAAVLGDRRVYEERADAALAAYKG